jgi:hypothetical protein
MNKDEIDKLLNNNFTEISTKNQQIDRLKEDIIKLYQDKKNLEELKKVIVFELVVDYIDVNQEIQFENVYGGGLSHKDKVKVIRKNKKSVTVKFLSTGYRWHEKKIGTTKRIPARIFGEGVYNTKHFKTMIDRNETLKALLG